VKDKTGVLTINCDDEAEAAQSVCECVDSVTRLQPEYISLDAFVPTIYFATDGKEGGATKDVVRTYVLRATQTIARETHLLTRWFDFETEDCVQDYYLCNTRIERLNMVERVEIDGHLISPYHYRGMGLVIQPPNMITVPKEACQVSVEASFVPAEHACEVDRVFFDRYRHIVDAWALAYLYEIPNQDWTDVRMSVVKKREAQGMMANIASEQRRGFHNGMVDLLVGVEL